MQVLGALMLYGLVRVVQACVGLWVYWWWWYWHRRRGDGGRLLSKMMMALMTRGPRWIVKCVVGVDDVGAEES